MAFLESMFQLVEQLEHSSLNTRNEGIESFEIMFLEVQEGIENNTMDSSGMITKMLWNKLFRVYFQTPFVEKGWKMNLQTMIINGLKNNIKVSGVQGATVCVNSLIGYLAKNGGCDRVKSFQLVCLLLQVLLLQHSVFVENDDKESLTNLEVIVKTLCVEGGVLLDSVYNCCSTKRFEQCFRFVRMMLTVPENLDAEVVPTELAYATYAFSVCLQSWGADSSAASMPSWSGLSVLFNLLENKTLGLRSMSDDDYQLMLTATSNKILVAYSNYMTCFLSDSNISASVSSGALRRSIVCLKNVFCAPCSVPWYESSGDLLKNITKKLAESFSTDVNSNYYRLMYNTFQMIVELMGSCSEGADVVVSVVVDTGGCLLTWLMKMLLDNSSSDTVLTPTQCMGLELLNCLLDLCGRDSVHGSYDVLVSSCTNAMLAKGSLAVSMSMQQQILFYVVMKMVGNHIYGRYVASGAAPVDLVSSVVPVLWSKYVEKDFTAMNSAAVSVQSASTVGILRFYNNENVRQAAAGAMAAWLVLPSALQSTKAASTAGKGKTGKSGAIAEGTGCGSIALCSIEKWLSTTSSSSNEFNDVSSGLYMVCKMLQIVDKQDWMVMLVTQYWILPFLASMKTFLKDGALKKQLIAQKCGIFLCRLLMHVACVCKSCAPAPLNDLNDEVSVAVVTSAIELNKAAGESLIGPANSWLWNIVTVVPTSGSSAASSFLYSKSLLSYYFGKKGTDAVQSQLDNILPSTTKAVSSFVCDAIVFGFQECVVDSMLCVFQSTVTVAPQQFESLFKVDSLDVGVLPLVSPNKLDFYTEPLCFDIAAKTGANKSTPPVGTFSNPLLILLTLLLHPVANIRTKLTRLGSSACQLRERLIKVLSFGNASDNCSAQCSKALFLYLSTMSTMIDNYAASLSGVKGVDVELPYVPTTSMLEGVINTLVESGIKHQTLNGGPRLLLSYLLLCIGNPLLYNASGNPLSMIGSRHYNSNSAEFCNFSIRHNEEEMVVGNCHKYRRPLQLWSKLNISCNNAGVTVVLDVPVVINELTRLLTCSEVTDYSIGMPVPQYLQKYSLVHQIAYCSLYIVGINCGNGISNGADVVNAFLPIVEGNLKGFMLDGLNGVTLDDLELYWSPKAYVAHKVENTKQTLAEAESQIKITNADRKRTGGKSSYGADLAEDEEWVQRMKKEKAAKLVQAATGGSSSTADLDSAIEKEVASRRNALSTLYSSVSCNIIAIEIVAASVSNLVLSEASENNVDVSKVLIKKLLPLLCGVLLPLSRYALLMDEYALGSPARSVVASCVYSLCKQLLCFDYREDDFTCRDLTTALIAVGGSYVDEGVKKCALVKETEGVNSAEASAIQRLFSTLHGVFKLNRDSEENNGSEFISFLLVFPVVSRILNVEDPVVGKRLSSTVRNVATSECFSMSFAVLHKWYHRLCIDGEAGAVHADSAMWLSHELTPSVLELIKRVLAGEAGNARTEDILVRTAVSGCRGTQQSRFLETFAVLGSGLLDSNANVRLACMKAVSAVNTTKSTEGLNSISFLLGQVSANASVTAGSIFDFIILNIYMLQFDDTATDGDGLTTIGKYAKELFDQLVNAYGVLRSVGSSVTPCLSFSLLQLACSPLNEAAPTKKKGIKSSSTVDEDSKLQKQVETVSRYYADMIVGSSSGATETVSNAVVRSSAGKAVVHFMMLMEQSQSGDGDDHAKATVRFLTEAFEKSLTVGSNTKSASGASFPGLTSSAPPPPPVSQAVSSVGTTVVSLSGSGSKGGVKKKGVSMLDNIGKGASSKPKLSLGMLPTPVPARSVSNSSVGSNDSFASSNSVPVGDTEEEDTMYVEGSVDYNHMLQNRAARIAIAECLCELASQHAIPPHDTATLEKLMEFVLEVGVVDNHIDVRNAMVKAGKAFVDVYGGKSSLGSASDTTACNLVIKQLIEKHLESSSNNSKSVSSTASPKKEAASVKAPVASIGAARSSLAKTNSSGIGRANTNNVLSSIGMGVKKPVVGGVGKGIGGVGGIGVGIGNGGVGKGASIGIGSIGVGKGNIAKLSDVGGAKPALSLPPSRESSEAGAVGSSTGRNSVNQQDRRHVASVILLGVMSKHLIAQAVEAAGGATTPFSSKESKYKVYSPLIDHIRNIGDMMVSILLKVSSSTVQKAVADSVFVFTQAIKPLIPAGATDTATVGSTLGDISRDILDGLLVLLFAGNPINKESSMSKVIHITTESSSYGERKGAAYGVAACVKGMGIVALKQFDIVNKAKEACSDANNSTNLIHGALCCIDCLSERLGLLFEPYILVLIPLLLKHFSHTSEMVRDSAQSTTTRIISRLSGHGLKQVMTPLLNNVGLSTESGRSSASGASAQQWKTRQESIKLLGSLMVSSNSGVSGTSKAQLASCLPQIIPKLVEALSDPHPKVKETARIALNDVSTVIKNPEVANLAPILLGALSDPAAKTKDALMALLQCEFIHSMDISSLALIVPTLTRALLKERIGDLKKKAAAITGNIINIVVASASATASNTVVVPGKKAPPSQHAQVLLLLQPYISTLLPGLLECLIDPIPDVRATAAKAIASLVSATTPKTSTDQEVEDMKMLFPWLTDTLVSNASPVERSGAAQGLAEVSVVIDTEHLDQLMSDILAHHTATKNQAREGVMWYLSFLPMALKSDYARYAELVLPIILRSIADDADNVREVASKAGVGLVTLSCVDTKASRHAKGKTHKTAAQAYTHKLLPMLLNGCSSNAHWRTRQCSVSLLGELLYKIGGGFNSNHDRDNVLEDLASSASARIAANASAHINNTAMMHKIYSVLYIARHDVVSTVRQIALTTWKNVVSNTPKTLVEIMPVLVQEIIGKLASGDGEEDFESDVDEDLEEEDSDYDESEGVEGPIGIGKSSSDQGNDMRAAASRALGELVAKLGDKILPVIIPRLRSALSNDAELEEEEEDDASVDSDASSVQKVRGASSISSRQGLCLGLAEIVSVATATLLEDYLESLIVPALLDALLCDDEEEDEEENTEESVLLALEIDDDEDPQEDLGGASAVRHIAAIAFHKMMKTMGSAAPGPAKGGNVSGSLNLGAGMGNSTGVNAALSAIVPLLLNHVAVLEDSNSNGDKRLGELSLLALKEMVLLRPREMLEYFLPKLLSGAGVCSVSHKPTSSGFSVSEMSNISSKILYVLAAATSNHMPHYYSHLMPFLVKVLIATRDTDELNHKFVQQACSAVMRNSSKTSLGVQYMMIEIGKLLDMGNTPDYTSTNANKNTDKVVENAMLCRSWGLWCMKEMLNSYVVGAETAGGVGGSKAYLVIDYVPIILKHLLARVTELDKGLLTELHLCFSVLTKVIPLDILMKQVGFIKNFLDSACSDARHRKGLYESILSISTLKSGTRKSKGQQNRPSLQLPLFLLIPKSVEPFLAIYLHALLYGSAAAPSSSVGGAPLNMKECAALAIGDLVFYSDMATVFKPFLIKTTGPLIRLVGELRNNASGNSTNNPIRIAIISTLSMLLECGGTSLKAFVPQLQATFLKSLSDLTSKQVRVASVHALSWLLPLVTRVDQLVLDVFNMIMNVNNESSDGDNVNTIMNMGVKVSLLEALASILSKCGSKVSPTVFNKLVEGFQYTLLFSEGNGNLDSNSYLMLMDQIEVVSGKVFKYICQHADEEVVVSLLTSLAEESSTDNFFTTCSRMIAVSNGVCGVYGNTKIMLSVIEAQGEHPIDLFRQNKLLPFIKSYLTASGMNMSADADAMTINEALRIAATKSVNVLLGPLVVEVSSVGSDVLKEYRRNNRSHIKYFAGDLARYSATDDGAGVGSDLLMTGINAIKTMFKYHHTAVLASESLPILVPPLVRIMKESTDIKLKYPAERALFYVLLILVSNATATVSTNNTSLVITAYVQAINSSGGDSGLNSIAYLKDIVRKTNPANIDECDSDDEV